MHILHVLTFTYAFSYLHLTYALIWHSLLTLNLTYGIDANALLILIRKCSENELLTLTSVSSTYFEP